MNNKKENDLYIEIFIISAILGFIADISIRDWVINNNINDFGLVGTLPSFFITFGSCIFAIRSSKNNIITMIFISSIIFIDEISQIWRNNKTFDYLDLIAIILGLSLAVLIFKLFSAKRK